MLFPLEKRVTPKGKRKKDIIVFSFLQTRGVSFVEKGREDVRISDSPKDEFMPILGEEEGLLVEKDGKLSLEEEIKEKIIKVFKEDGGGQRQAHPRIFGKREEGDKEDAERKAAAAVKILMEEDKVPLEVSHEEKAGTEKIRPDLLKILSKEKPTLANAEVIVVKGTEYALALSYSTGMIPKIIAKARGDKALKMIRDAFKIDLPVVEVLDWDVRNFKHLEVGVEIPESFYPTAAKALALVYRIKPDAHLVRFVKPEKGSKSSRSKKAKKMVDRYRDLLKISPLAIVVSEEIYSHKEKMRELINITIDRFVSQMGVPVPKVNIKKDIHLKQGEFLIKIKDVTYSVGSLDSKLAFPDLLYPIQNQMKSLLHNFSYELLGYAETEALVSLVREEHPTLVRNLIPKRFTLGALRFVLRGLLREQIPIKDMATILETIDGYVNTTQDPELLVEYVRSAFAQYISGKYKDEDGNLNVLLLSRATEEKVLFSLREKMNVRWLEMDYNEGLKFLTALGNELNNIGKLGIKPVILTSPTIRRFIRRITETSFPEVPVLSYSEIAPFTPVKTVGLIDIGRS